MTFLYALATHWPKFKHNRSKIYTKIFKPAVKGHTLVYVWQALLLPLFCFIMFSNAQAQSSENREADAGLTDIKPLQIGDTIPEDLWHMPLQVVNHPDRKDTITLNDYRDRKLIILDFWSSWCGPCVRSLKEIDNIQKKYKKEVAVFLITNDRPQKIKDFMCSNDYAKGVELPIISQTSYLFSHFPHASISHIIIIDSKDKILGITGSGSIKISNIDRIMNNKEFIFPVKTELDQ